jgi:hypothetical protein
MNLRLVAIFSAVAIVLSGCVTAPQGPVTMSQDEIVKHEGRIGVAMTAVPKIDMAYPGAGCLLCLATAAVTNSSLSTHAHTLTTDEVSSIRGNMVAALKKKGFTVVEITDAIDVNKLPDAHAKSAGHPKKDFGSLKTKYNVDKLCVLEVDQIGFTRQYAAYVPTADPEAILTGKAFIVDLSTNAYDWYTPITVVKPADGKWDEPPAFPGLTNAYFQAIELARDAYLGPFKN